MNDTNKVSLLKAAQAVIDDYRGGNVLYYSKLIETLRQAVEQAKGVEAVLYVNKTDLENELFTGINAARKNHPDFGKHYTVPLYTTPPSVDALIADAVAKEREACARVCVAFGKTLEDNNGENYAEEIRARSKP